MRTVAIVGSHSNGRATAPFDRADVQIWAFNGLAGKPDTWLTRVNAVFQMHRPEIYRSPHNREDPNHWAWLQQPHPFPIYMLDADPDVPASRAYPLDHVAQALIPGWRQNGQGKIYFSSSIDYAIALAIYRGFDRIELHGIEMSSDTEYTYQRVGVALWVGVALGCGVDVEIYGGEAIFDRPLYGYEGNLTHNLAAMQERLITLAQERETARALVYRAEAQLAEGWQARELPEFIGVLRETHKRFGYWSGAHDELQRYALKVAAAERAGNPAYLDRNEHETAAFAAKTDCSEQDRMMKESAGRIGVMLQSWDSTGSPDALGWLKKFVAEHAVYADKLGKANGIMQENLRLMKQADLSITAAGGEKALEYVQADHEPQPELSEV